jgi:hypothetical protein
MKFLYSFLAITVLSSSLAHSQSIGKMASQYVSAVSKSLSGEKTCKFKLYLYSVKMNYDYDRSYYPNDEVRISIRKRSESDYKIRKDIVIKDGKHNTKMYLSTPTYFYWGDIDEYDIDFKVDEENGMGGLDNIVSARPTKSANGDDISQDRFDKYELQKMTPSDTGSRDRVYVKNTSSKFGDSKIWKSRTEIQFESWRDSLEDKDAWQGPEVSIMKVSNCSVDEVTKFIEKRNDKRDNLNNFGDTRNVVQDQQGGYALDDLGTDLDASTSDHNADGHVCQSDNCFK